MIDVRELRIGNYLMDKCGIAQVAGIPCGKEEQEEWLANMEPVPLKEELLDRLFERGYELCEPYGSHNNKTYPKWILSPGFLVALINGRFFIVKEEGGYYVVMYKEVEAFHQLQNLYFDFTGKELEVKL